jgi:hypothetical protein
MSHEEVPIRDALDASVTETFTGMAFLDAIPAEAPQETGEFQVFAIQIRGPRTHTLVLDLPLGIKQSIVENIHAAPWEELSSSDIDDCLLEFLNVLGGSFGRTLWGDESRYKLGFPEVRIGIPEDLDATRLESFWFDAYGQVFAVHVVEE